VALDSRAVAWSEVKRANEVELSEIKGKREDGRGISLGSGKTGSLTWCGQHVWFAKDGDDDEGGFLLRWSPEDGLQEVLNVPYTKGFLSKPLCSGNALAVTVLGDETTKVLTVSLADE